jgi:hypothetical protein
MVSKEKTMDTSIETEEVISIMVEAATRIRELVLTDARAYSDIFPQLEVAEDVDDKRQKGAIALGHIYHPTKTIPGIIVNAYHYGQQAVVLTPDGLYRTSNVSPAFYKNVFRLNTEQKQEDTDLLWVTYGIDASKKLDELERQQSNLDTSR